VGRGHAERTIVSLHWRKDLLTITYDDGQTARAVTGEATAKEIANDFGLVVFGGTTGDGSRLWGRQGGGRRPMT
jgi:hypothetical protein